jgi:hypothetical protein
MATPVRRTYGRGWSHLDVSPAHHFRFLTLTFLFFPACRQWLKILGRPGGAGALCVSPGVPLFPGPPFRTPSGVAWYFNKDDGVCEYALGARVIPAARPDPMIARRQAADDASAAHAEAIAAAAAEARELADAFEGDLGDEDGMLGDYAGAGDDHVGFHYGDGDDAEMAGDALDERGGDSPLYDDLASRMSSPIYAPPDAASVSSSPVYQLGPTMSSPIYDE